MWNIFKHIRHAEIIILYLGILFNIYSYQEAWVALYSNRKGTEDGVSSLSGGLVLQRIMFQFQRTIKYIEFLRPKVKI